MARAKPLVVLFEDDEINGARIAKAISRALPKNIRFQQFEDEGPRAGAGAYEDLVHKQLATPKYSGLALLVTDRDLSKSQRYPGLSEAVISKVAARLAIPICIYAAGQADSVLQRQRSGGDSRIILDSKDEDAMAHRVTIIVEGFIRIARSLYSPKIGQLRRKAQGPATVLAGILGRPEIADHLSLYATGDQKMIAELMPVRDVNDEVALKKRIPTTLGYWLYDSVLRFPGIVVNEAAAASYLNIDLEQFRNGPRIQKLFRGALYEGPFADPKAPIWWRDKLDDLLQKARVEDGRVLVRKALKISVKQCLDGRRRAGYYCVVSGNPVSKENSRGQISWLPRGADLSRVRQDIYDELAPWIGLS